jgi:ribonucleoside-diphosphate reductase alpha chain
MTEPYYWLNDISLRTLSRGYLDAEDIKKYDVRPAALKRYEAIADASVRFLKKMGIDRPGHKEKLLHGWSMGWASLSTPVVGNFGTDRGLAISCNGSYVGDSMESILYNYHEMGELMRNGAGTSSYLDVRPKGTPTSKGGTSGGVVPWMGLAGHYTTAITQAGLRRGSWAGYISIESADIHDFLRIKDPMHPVQHVSFGVTITDKWMSDMLEEPVGGAKRMLMVDIILKRRQSGYPYVIFIDTANKALHPRARELGRKIWASNLCTEIFLPANEEETFVCNLSSVNLAKYDEWKNTDWIETMVYFLDSVMEEYIEKTADQPYLKRPHLFAKNWRALGLGTLGYHTALQQKMIPFESNRARALNIEMHKTLQDQSYAASRKMAEEIGEADLMKGTGQRHLTLNAIAPTRSSSIILGQVSQSIEPWEANIFDDDNAKSVYTKINPVFVECLESHGKNTPDVWRSIAELGGSAQHLDFLTPLEKRVFKTFSEIDPMEVVRQAGDRAVFIDQGQSLNIKVRNDASIEDNFAYIVAAWLWGQKSLYYHFNDASSARKLLRDNKSKINKVAEPEVILADCLACEA